MTIITELLTVPFAFTREDMVDAIATAISDSMDIDWNSSTGAEAVVRNCGVWELYEALEKQERAELANANCPECAGEGNWAECERCSGLFGGAIDARNAALTKARGEA